MMESEKTPLFSSDQAKISSVHVDIPSSQSQHKDVTRTSLTESGVSRNTNFSHSGASGRSGDFCQRSFAIEPIHLSWENVSVYVNTEKSFFGGSKDGSSQKQILKNVTGLVRPGTLLAVIGASGAGKSTLINVLTGRNTAQYTTTGSIKVNGMELGRGITHISAYCQQDEMFFETLTVREHLVFRAMLRMDNSLSERARLKRVDQVMLEMGLTKCADTRIGHPGKKKGLSGGEMKRLSFASEAIKEHEEHPKTVDSPGRKGKKGYQEILTNPPLMFCDEPTSGLDSFMAQNIVQTLHSLAGKNRTVMCSIHQPSSEIFAMFDEVLILGEGRTAFMGPARDAYKFFGNLGHPCPQNFNPADFYILTLAIVPGRETDSRKKVKTVCDAFADSDRFRCLKTDIKEACAKKTMQSSAILFEEAFGKQTDRYTTSWLQQFRAVLWRSWVHLVRDVVLLRVRVMQTAVLGVMMGLVYLDTDYDEIGVMDINGAIFLLIVNASFTSMFSVIHSFPIEMYIFLREHGSGLYRVDVYYLAKTLAELPTFVFLPFVFHTIMYWMIGLYSDATTYIISAGSLVLVANVAVSFGYMLSTVSGSVDIALAIGPPLMIPLMLFGGLFINNGSVPDYFIWLKYLSWFQYGNEVLSVNQWENVKSIECTETGEDIRNCYTNGDEVLETINFSKDNFILDLCLLVALLVGYRLISYLGLLFKAWRSKS